MKQFMMPKLYKQKLINYRLKKEDSTFTIIAKRPHIPAETEGFTQQTREIHGPVKLIAKGAPQNRLW